MATDEHMQALRGFLVTAALAHAPSHAHLSAYCQQIGLPPPGEGTKYERIEASVAAAPRGDLPRIARLILAGHRLEPSQRNQLQDRLWAVEQHVPVPKRTRREVARALDLEDLVLDQDRFMALLDRVWVLSDEPLVVFLGGTDLRAQIHQHVLRNPGDWTTEQLFDNLGAFDAPDRRFTLFLEGLASADVLLDEPAQRHLVQTVNAVLHTAGLELRETAVDGGYPVFTVVPVGATTGRPKNIVFAALPDAGKPDIRLSDGVNNDVQIATNAHMVLFYDRPIGTDGIRWRDLQDWWKDTQGFSSDKQAKDTLYARLLQSLPENSPPQRLLFDLYHRIHGPTVPGLPALLPEVWLHWDPKTVRERGAHALLGLRMDFLMLLPGGHRIVLEVDGKHHYSVNGRLSPTRYARNVQGDRDLKLRGYEVFRFGAVELPGPDAPASEHKNARDMVERFFADLFRRFGVPAA